MLSLTQLNERHKSDKGMAGRHPGDHPHSYIENYYEKTFATLKSSTKNILEVGVSKGDSMKLWYDYFQNATVYGVDKFPKWDDKDKQKYIDRCKIIIGNSVQEQTYVDISNQLDIIIDDGSHKIHHQLQTFKLLFPKLKTNGLYIIEDIMDIDSNIESFMSLHSNVKIYDFRSITKKFDDVIIEIKK